MNNHLKSAPQASRSSITATIIIVLSVMAVISTWAYYLIHKHEIYKEHTKRMITVSNERINRLSRIMQSYIKQGEMRLSSGYIQEVLKKLNKVQPSDIKTSSLVSEQTKNLALFLEQHSTEFLYENTLLIRPDGLVIFSDTIPEYVGKNLLHAPYKDSALGQSFLRTFMTLTMDIAEYSFDQVFKKPAFFILLPILDGDKFIGVLAQRIRNESIYELSDDYLGLGDTGDVVLGEKHPEGILLIGKERLEKNIPFKKFLPFRTYGDIFPLALASSGYEGAGIAHDYHNIPVIAAWNYVEKVNWGIMAKINEQEVKDSVRWLMLLAYLITLCALFLILFEAARAPWMGTTYQSIVTLLSQKFWYRAVRITVFFLMLMLVTFLFTRYFVEKRKNLQDTKLKAAQEVRNAVESISLIASTMESIGQGLANDLGTGRLKKEDLMTRIKRELHEEKRLIGITVAFAQYGYDKSKRLYAPYVSKKNGEIIVEQLEQTYDYLKEAPAVEGQEAKAWAWYAQPIKEKSLVWFDVYRDKRDYSKLLVGYSVPFYDINDKKKERALGVVNVVLDMDEIESVIANLSVGATGYGIMLSASGNFIYYPISEYVEKQSTIFTLAQEQGSTRLSALGHAMMQNDTGFGQYYDRQSKYLMWMYFERAPVTKWIVAITFSEKDTYLYSYEVRFYYIWLLISILLLICALYWLLIELPYVGSSAVYVMTTIFLAAILGLFFIIRATTENEHAEQDIIIYDQVHLNQFLQERDQYAHAVAEQPPIRIPLGVYIFNISFPNSTSIDVAGYIWMKFDKTIDKSLIREPQFPSAIAKVDIRKSYEAKEGDLLKIGWQFSARLSQDLTYATYPFDMPLLRIEIEHPDFAKNVLLVPSLQDYRDQLPEQLPGTFADFDIPGFSKIKSFFSYAIDIGDTDLGLQSYKETVNRFYLTYNILLKRHLLYDLIVFLLPIFIVFLILYALSWVAEKEWVPVMIISAYTSLLFATILLHRVLRDRYLAADILYIEYLFFLIYLTIVPLVIYMLSRVYYKPEEMPRIFSYFSWYRKFYWPIQLALLFIITIIVFYPYS